jgi:hypothetical protein
LTVVERRRCGLKGALRGRGFGPWTAQVSLREVREGRRVGGVGEAGSSR